MRAVDEQAQDPGRAEAADAIAVTVREAMDAMMRDSPRSEWAKANQLGVSDIGGCHEFVRRTLMDEPWSDEQSDYAAAFVGTAVGDLAERAVINHLSGTRVHAESQVEVTVHLSVAGYTFDLPGHPDLVTDRSVWDFKTVDGLAVVRRTGPTEKQWWQVFLYAKALIDAGRLPADAWCVLIFIDRSGREPEPVVFVRRFSMDVVAEAVAWMEDVVYALQHDEEAMKDMPRTWCWACCPRATACRGGDTDATGYISNPQFRAAVEVHIEATESAKVAKNALAAAKSVLANVEGSTGDHSVRWVHINPVDKAPYKRLDIRPINKVANVDPVPEQGA